MTDRPVAIVTGGAGGIGQATSRRLAEDGALVVLADIDEAAAKAVADALMAGWVAGGAAGGDRRVEPAALDVTDPASVQRLVDDLVARFGRIDILVNNAGFPRDAPLTKMTDAEFRSVLDVCLFGSFACARAVAPVMIEHQYGRIVNMASRAYLGNPGQANYSAAKAGVVGLTKALAKELGRHNITVNAVAPGIIETDAVRAHPKYDLLTSLAHKQNSIRRLGSPEDVADAIAYLASARASFLTGDVLHVSGGRFS
ncbi:SDR family NAD(P)-dependent oxidoreductase [Sphaerisporangium sp. NPDC088356]|uniref:SDR family oxidoreductase n=1 Tax=Sphaerisporangium sp. NPDC088356 TaxID=3154871 RepID=UPI00343D97D0